MRTTLKNSFAVVAILMGFTILFSCTNSQQGATGEKPAFDAANAKKEIEEANKSFMDFIAKGDSAGVANLYTTDGKLMFAEMPAVTGRPGIQSVFSGIIKSGVTKLDIKTADVFEAGDMLIEEGEVTVYVKENAVANEKYIVVWKKEDGKWKLFRDIANSNAPAK